MVSRQRVNPWLSAQGFIRTCYEPRQGDNIPRPKRTLWRSLPTKYLLNLASKPILFVTVAQPHSGCLPKLKQIQQRVSCIAACALSFVRGIVTALALALAVESS